MQSDETIPWQMQPQQQCRSCGAMADRMTLGHMFRMDCVWCGTEEMGTFSPAIDPELPRAKPFDVFLDCSAVAFSAHNMFMLSRLHESLSKLKPVERKSLISLGKPHYIGQLYLEEIEKLQKATANSAFIVLIDEQDSH